MCDVLREIYQEIYDAKFDFNNFDDRKKMQKAIYLLENMGVYVGDYSFSWDKYGPYSIGLDCDAQRICKGENLNVGFSEFAKNRFAELRGYIKEQDAYNCVDWMECIASLHYLKEVLKINDENLIPELVNRKNYLNNNISNKKALAIVEKIRNIE